MDLTQVRLRRVDGHSGAMLHERTGVNVAVDADPRDEVEPVRRLLREAVLPAAVQGHDLRHAHSKADRDRPVITRSVPTPIVPAVADARSSVAQTPFADRA